VSNLKPNKIVEMPLQQLKPNPSNARLHSDNQIDELAKSLLAYGFIGNVVITADNTIVSGHARVEAAKRAGLVTVPTVLVDHLSPDQIRAFAIADNRLADLATWDVEKLAAEFEALAELDFDLELTGFTIPEIDILIEEVKGSDPCSNETDDDLVDLEIDRPVVSIPGDLWLLDRHRLFTGDALNHESYDCLMPDEKAEAAISDLPYNVRIAGHVGGNGRIKHGEFLQASGEMTEAEFTVFLSKAFTQIAANTNRGALAYIFCDWRHLFEFLTAGRSVFAELVNLCVWAKTTGGMGSMYRSQHELVLLFKANKGRHRNNVQLGRHGRNRTNVWSYPGVNSFGEGRDEALASHPTVKPVAMIADAILDCTCRNGIVLDPFAGSGTILIAAEKTGRTARAIELDPAYVDVAAQRWQTYTGKQAVLQETGQTFAEVQAERQRGGAGGTPQSVELRE
jgi:DNA modification methylase